MSQHHDEHHHHGHGHDGHEHGHGHHGHGHDHGHRGHEHGCGCHGHGHGHGPDWREVPLRAGILLVAFGSSVAEAWSAYRYLHDVAASHFPDLPVRLAFSSKTAAKKLTSVPGTDTPIEAPAVALAGMLHEGFTHVAVQSLHTIAGRENADVAEVVEGFASFNKGFVRLSMGQPLLSDCDSIEAAAKGLAVSLDAPRPGHAHVFMGHGSRTGGLISYPALAYYLGLERPDLFLATPDDHPSFTALPARLKQQGVTSVTLHPLMAVAGHHARVDMAGNAPHAWQARLEEQGFTVDCSLTGAAEIPALAEIWIGHLHRAVNALNLPKDLAGATTRLR